MVFTATGTIRSVRGGKRPPERRSHTGYFATRPNHSLARRSDGTVWAWGNNDYGQLGNGTTTTSLTPVQVSALTGVSAIATGTWHSLALTSGGTVWAWGLNDGGQLGNGTTTTQYPAPVQASIVL